MEVESFSVSFDERVYSFHLYPGIDIAAQLQLVVDKYKQSQDTLATYFSERKIMTYEQRKQAVKKGTYIHYRAIIIRAFGTGNGPSIPKQCVEDLKSAHIPVFVVTECARGSTALTYAAAIKVTTLRKFITQP